MTEENDSFVLQKSQILEDFNDEQVSFLYFCGWIVDGRAGGFIVGRTHPTDSILCFVRHDDGKFSNIHVDGFEYVINPYAAERNFARLQELNSFQDEHHTLQEIPLSLASRIINTSAQPQDKYILMLNGGFIINRRATAKHFKELEEINNSSNPYNYYDINYLNPANRDNRDENGNIVIKLPR